MFDGGWTVGLFGGELGYEAGEVYWGHLVKGLEFWVQTFRSYCEILFPAPLT